MESFSSALCDYEIVWMKWFATGIPIHSTEWGVRETRIEFYINLLLNCSRFNSFFSSRCQHRCPKRTVIAKD